MAREDRPGQRPHRGREPARAHCEASPWDPESGLPLPVADRSPTGVGYNRKSTGRDLTSIADMFDPAVRRQGDVPRRLPGHVRAYLAPAARPAARSPTTPSDLTAEDGAEDPRLPASRTSTTATSGRSPGTSTSRTSAAATPGSRSSSRATWPRQAAPDDVFVYPTEGSIIWTDNLLIPKGAMHKRAAEAMIDFVYDPQIAARLANAIYYISPVEGRSRGDHGTRSRGAPATRCSSRRPTWSRSSTARSWSRRRRTRRFSDLMADLEGA